VKGKSVPVGTGDRKTKRQNTSELSRVSGAPSPDEISRRAYELSLERGCTHDSELGDWLQPERELKEK